MDNKDSGEQICPACHHSSIRLNAEGVCEGLIEDENDNLDSGKLCGHKCSFSEAAAEDQNSNDEDKNSSGPRTESQATLELSATPSPQTLELDELAFESKQADRGYTVRATYLKQPKGDALVEVFKDGAPLRAFLFPAYKVWNIAAHFSDIVDGEIEGNARGYEMAAWDGISNAVFYIPERETETQLQG